MADYKLDKQAKYADTHEWVRIEGDVAVVGISDAAQDLLSDVVFVELPSVGEEVSAGDSVAVREGSRDPVTTISESWAVGSPGSWAWTRARTASDNMGVPGLDHDS